MQHAINEYMLYSGMQIRRSLVRDGDALTADYPGVASFHFNNILSRALAGCKFYSLPALFFVLHWQAQNQVVAPGPNMQAQTNHSNKILGRTRPKDAGPEPTRGTEPATPAASFIALLFPEPQ